MPNIKIYNKKINVLFHGGANHVLFHAYNIEKKICHKVWKCSRWKSKKQ